MILILVSVSRWYGTEQLDSRGEQPARLLGQPQTGQQADDEVHDEEQQVGEPPAETHTENQAVGAGSVLLLRFIKMITLFIRYIQKKW